MQTARKNKSFRGIASALIAAALVVAPIVATGASADDAPPTLVGEVGVMQPWTQETNHVEHWQGVYPGTTCVKDDGSLGSITGNALTVTLQAAPAGQQWVALIVKAGNLWNNVVANPKVGTAYASPVNNGGNQAAVSHWIACYGPSTPPVQPEKPAPLSTPKVVVTFECGADETTTTTITTTDWVWDAAANEWVLGTPVVGEPTVTHAPLTPDELATCHSETPPPTVTVSYSDWKDGTWVCGETTVTQKRTKTTTTTPSEGKATTVEETQTQTRQLTHDEIGTCPLVPGNIAASCVGDVPYLSYAVALPNGFSVESSTPVRITFVNPNEGGVDYVVNANPLSGKILWPGASDGTPKMWPGWDLVNGKYVPTSGNFAWTREGVKVRFDVNPTYSTTVTYPAATVACANPQPTAEDPESTPAATPAATPVPAANGDDLAQTGGTGVSPIAITAGAAALVLGIAAVGFTAYRRRRHGAE